jgi:circadian clock protein KaiC
LVGEYAEETMTDLPEFAIADGILLLVKQSSDVREQRFLRVEKLRGSGSLQGMHAFDITERGIRTYPRLLTPAVSPVYRMDVERVNTGIEGLDSLIETGFWRGSTTLVAGPSGSGKTTIGLHFTRAGVIRDEPSVYLCFQENPVQLARTMQNFEWDPRTLLQNPNFELLYRSPVEMQLDSVATELFDRVREGRVKRVVIDALGDLQKSSSDARRFSDFIYALTQWFAVRNVTSMLIYELHELFDPTSISADQISNMSDNVIMLRFKPESEMARLARVVKTRGSDHDKREWLLEISKVGVTIKSPVN